VLRTNRTDVLLSATNLYLVTNIKLVQFSWFSVGTLWFTLRRNLWANGRWRWCWRSYWCVFVYCILWVFTVSFIMCCVDRELLSPASGAFALGDIISHFSCMWILYACDCIYDLAKCQLLSILLVCPVRDKSSYKLQYVSAAFTMVFYLLLLNSCNKWRRRGRWWWWWWNRWNK